MNKTYLFMAIFALLLSACGDRHSKVYNELEQEVKTLELKINEMKDCDELQLMGFGIMGLRSDLANGLQTNEVHEAEVQPLEDMINRLETAWMEKKASNGCSDSLEGSDELDTSGEEDLPAE
jgi:hypothetical protein